MNDYAHRCNPLPAPEYFMECLGIALKLLKDLRGSENRRDTFNQPRRVRERVDPVRNPSNIPYNLLASLGKHEIDEQLSCIWMRRL